MYKILIFSVLLFFQSHSLSAQEITPSLKDSLENLKSLSPQLLQALEDSIQQKTATTDTAVTAQDSTEISQFLSDSISYKTDTAQTLAPEPSGDIKTTIEYSAKDSIKTDLANNKVYLYGDAQIVYGDIQLNADRIEIDYATNTLSATYSEDSLGNKIGYPIFRDGNEEFQTDGIRYNFSTRKAFIKGIITQQGDAYMHGDVVKKNEKDELFINTAKYTTCNLAEPHYHIQAKRLKVIPGNKLVAGPFNLYFNDAPTIIGFPFGMFPDQQQRTSGVIFPQYGEQQSRGFFLRDGGYFWAINDYMNLALTGEIYTKGGWGLRARSNYVKRYAFQGNVDFTYSEFNTGAEEDTINQQTFRINWSHNPISTGNSRLSASVSAQSNNFNDINLQDNPTQQINAILNSNVSYSVNFPGTPFSLASNFRLNQNLITEQVDLTFPTLSFNMNSIFPFQPKTGTGNKWYQKIRVNYRLDLENRITNVIDNDSIAPFNFETLPELLDQSQRGMRHTSAISTNFKVLKNFTISPNFNYNEVWYLERLTRSYDESLEEINVDTVQAFSRAGWFTTGASLTTQLYGTKYFKGDLVRALRHTMIPNISYTYNPDFSEPFFDYYQEVQTNPEGDLDRFSRFQGRQFIYGGPPEGANQSVGFSLQNTLEMKLGPSKKDTTDTERKVKLLENFAVSTSYNFEADSFNLSNINLSARTTLFKNILNINVTSTINPYIYVRDTAFTSSGEIEQGTRINEFAWNNGQGLGQIQNVSVNSSLNLKGSNKKSKQREQEIDELKSKYSPEEQAQLDQILNNSDQYIDFNVPWTLRANYNVSRRVTGFSEPTIVQVLQFSGDLSLTDRLKIAFNSGYDIDNREFTQTNINVAMNLHCWEMNLQWVPFGALESYSFVIRVKSSLLQDLKFNRTRQFTEFQ